MKNIILIMLFFSPLLLLAQQGYRIDNSGNKNGVRWEARWYYETPSDNAHWDYHFFNSTNTTKNVSYREAYIQTSTNGLIQQNSTSSIDISSGRSYLSSPLYPKHGYGTQFVELWEFKVTDAN